MTKARGLSLVAFPLAVALLGSVLHCLQRMPGVWWAEVVPSLYYLPIVAAAIILGTKAAVGVALAAGVSQVLTIVLGCGHPWSRALSDTALFTCVGLTAGKLAQMHAKLSRGRELLLKTTDENLYRAFSGRQSTKQIPGFAQVAAGLIHRFRTPVSSIEGAVWLLENPQLPQEKREEAVGIIRKESHQLERALSDILHFTQPRKPRFREVNFSVLLDQVIQLASPKEHGPFFLFQKEIPPNLPPIRCDPEMIRRLLLNIAMNAIEATPGGGQITIAVRLEQRSLTILISDHGRGIAPENVSRIFDPFFTTHESGLGLGLAVARQIAVAHRGTIALGKTSGTGTTIVVSLPLNAPETHEYGPHTCS